MKKKKHLQNIDYFNSIQDYLNYFCLFIYWYFTAYEVSFFQDAGMYSGETGEKTEAHYRTTQHYLAVLHTEWQQRRFLKRRTEKRYVQPSV